MNTRGDQPVIYTLIGYVLLAMFALLILAIFAGATNLAISHNVSRDSYAKWLGFIIFTIAGFGVIIKASNDLWHNRIFWIVLGGLFLIHTLVFSIVLWHVEHWGLASSLVIYLIEVPVLAQLLLWARRRFSKSRRSASLKART